MDNGGPPQRAGVRIRHRAGTIRRDPVQTNARRQYPAVPHGYRSSFRDWAAELTDTPRQICELALAHVNNDRVEAAYQRSDLFDRRRQLMQQWADYLHNQTPALPD